MEKVFTSKYSLDKEGKGKSETVELNTIKATLTELDGQQLGMLMSLVEFQQRISNLFFDDNDKYEAYQDEVDKALKELHKIKDPTDQDLKKCERIIAKALEDNCDVNGKSLVLEIARKICKRINIRDIVSGTFSINEVFEDNLYSWMY